MLRVFKAVFGFLSALLALLFVVGYAAAYLHPGRFWLAALVAVWLPYLSMAVLLAALMAILLRMRRWVVVQLVLLVLVALRFLPEGWWRPRPEPARNDLVLMTFNAPLTGPSADELTREMLHFVRAEEPDLITLQESAVWLDPEPLRVRATKHIAGLIDSLDYTSYVPQGIGWRYAIHQPILERSVEILEQTQTDLRQAPQDDDRTYVVRTRFRWQGREAVLYNVHLRTYGNRKPWRRDMKVFSIEFWRPYLRMYRANYWLRAREIQRIRDMIERETLPVIISGDLNSTPHNWEYRTLGAGLQDAFKVAGKGWGGTWHSRLPLVRIDHVLVSDAFRIVAARVPDVRFSDHRPVVVSLRWRE